MIELSEQMFQHVHDQGTFDNLVAVILLFINNEQRELDKICNLYPRKPIKTDYQTKLRIRMIKSLCALFAIRYTYSESGRTHLEMRQSAQQQRGVVHVLVIDGHVLP